MPLDVAVRRRRARIALLALIVAVATFVLHGVDRRAERGRLALLKWKPTFEALERGEAIYLLEARGLPQVGSEPEGYPTPPITALVLSRFSALGDRPGAIAYATVQLLLAAFVLAASARLAGASAWPPWAAVLLVALGLRVILSDVSHGNTNLIVAALVTACAVAWARGLPFLAGVAAAAGAAFKVAPALLVLFFVVRPSGRALVGFAAGLALLLWILPGLALGFGANATHLGDWARQMLVPYLSGAPPGVMQSAQINQSLFGLALRLFTDAIAIEARGTVWTSDVRVTLVELPVGVLRIGVALLQVAVVALAGAIAWRRGELRDPRGSLLAIAAFALAMLLVNERSWKHHHVLALPAVAALVGELRGGHRRVAAIGLGAAALGYSLSGSFPLGARGSDLAEAYGAFTVATATLLGCLARIGLARGSVAEVPQAGEHHRRTARVAGGDDGGIADRTAGLQDR